ncbi:hypothetical protein FA15DRAFT_702430 [Coprinopsis marcescibilis]|uniref:HTH CENPB-type domain-containing protein n=1 Tax=Coprinopsis marcescibilis TaxID=230819 RepID=A0A5C3L3V5_COPMA|nr:hypothetical protein FA15DRAFT_702430 [Coprinopsis marcescibilis]
MLKAVLGYHSGRFKKRSKAAREMNVNYNTLLGWLSGKHDGDKVASQRKWVLMPAQELPIINWIKQKSETGALLDRRELCDIASDVLGRCIGKSFANWFLKQSPQLVTAKSAKLDPK